VAIERDEYTDTVMSAIAAAVAIQETKEYNEHCSLLQGNLTSPRERYGEGEIHIKQRLAAIMSA
jgi:hypothetical protein